MSDVYRLAHSHVLVKRDGLFVVYPWEPGPTAGAVRGVFVPRSPGCVKYVPSCVQRTQVFLFSFEPFHLM